MPTSIQIQFPRFRYVLFSIGRARGFWGWRLKHALCFDFFSFSRHRLKCSGELSANDSANLKAYRSSTEKKVDPSLMVTPLMLNIYFLVYSRSYRAVQISNHTVLRYISKRDLPAFSGHSFAGS